MNLRCLRMHIRECRIKCLRTTVRSDEAGWTAKVRYLRACRFGLRLRLLSHRHTGPSREPAARRPSRPRSRSAATAAQSREWTSPPRPRQSRSEWNLEVKATGTALDPPPYRRGRRLQCRLGRAARPPARISARGDQGGHGPASRSSQQYFAGQSQSRPRAAGCRVVAGKGPYPRRTADSRLHLQIPSPDSISGLSRDSISRFHLQIPVDSKSRRAVKRFHLQIPSPDSISRFQVSTGAHSHRSRTRHDRASAVYSPRPRRSPSNGIRSTLGRRCTCAFNPTPRPFLAD